MLISWTVLADRQRSKRENLQTCGIQIFQKRLFFSNFRLCILVSWVYPIYGRQEILLFWYMRKLRICIFCKNKRKRGFYMKKKMVNMLIAAAVSICMAAAPVSAATWVKDGPFSCSASSDWKNAPVPPNMARKWSDWPVSPKRNVSPPVSRNS